MMSRTVDAEKMQTEGQRLVDYLADRITDPSSTTPNSSSTVAPTCSGCCARDGSLARFFCLSKRRPGS